MAFTRPVNAACADFLTAGGRFVEAIVAPSFDADALEILQTRPKWGQNVRLLSCGAFGPDVRANGSLELKQLVGGFLLQERDLSRETSAEMKVVTQEGPSDDQLSALDFANRVCKHVKSNAIVLASALEGDVLAIVGVGAGQMSRVDSVELSVRKAGDRASGSVLASDAFFPFADGVEAAIQAGIEAVLQPGGSRRDVRNVVHGERSPSVSGSRSGPRPRPSPSSKRNTTRQLPETRTLHLARTVALEGMQPEARRVGAIRMCRLLQPKQDAPEPWHQTRRQSRNIAPLVQRP